MNGQVVFQYQGVKHTVTQLSQNSSSEEVSVWKFRMEMILEEHDCWEAVSKERCLHWDERDKTARVLIVKTLSDDLVLLAKGKSARQMWEALVDKFEKAGQPTEVKVETGTDSTQVKVETGTDSTQVKVETGTDSTQDDNRTGWNWEAIVVSGLALAAPIIGFALPVVATVVQRALTVYTAARAVFRFFFW